MSVRARVKALAFHDGEAEWWGDFNQGLANLNAKFRLELHGDDAVYGGTAIVDPGDGWETQLNWDQVPPGDRQFFANLERFVGTAFRMSVYLRLVVEPVDLDEVEEEYLEDEEEEEDAV